VVHPGQDLHLVQRHLAVGRALRVEVGKIYYLQLYYYLYLLTIYSALHTFL
jgi:hypothetical protein